MLSTTTVVFFRSERSWNARAYMGFRSLRSVKSVKSVNPNKVGIVEGAKSVNLRSGRVLGN